MGKADTQTPRVTKKDIVDGLRKLGLGPEDGIMVHSSLSAFGYVEHTDRPTDAAIIDALLAQSGEGATSRERMASKVKGANTVIDALLECVGQDGVLMMPSFNHGHAELYDPLTTPTRNGIIPDVFWRLPGVGRSLHPTHPYAAWGRDARRLLAGHEQVSTFDGDCPLGRLISEGGSVLMLGVGLDRCSAMHVAETIAGVPCLGYREGLARALMNGRETYVPTHVWRSPGECHLEHSALEPRMREAGMIRDSAVGGAEVHLVRGADLVEVALAIAREYCLPKCPTRPNYKVAADRLREHILSLQRQGRIR